MLCSSISIASQEICISNKDVNNDKLKQAKLMPNKIIPVALNSINNANIDSVHSRKEQKRSGQFQF